MPHRSRGSRPKGRQRNPGYPFPGRLRPDRSTARTVGRQPQATRDTTAVNRLRYHPLSRVTSSIFYGLMHAQSRAHRRAFLRPTAVIFPAGDVILPNFAGGARHPGRAPATRRIQPDPGAPGSPVPPATRPRGPPDARRLQSTTAQAERTVDAPGTAFRPLRTPPPIQQAGLPAPAGPPARATALIHRRLHTGQIMSIRGNAYRMRHRRELSMTLRSPEAKTEAPAAAISPEGCSIALRARHPHQPGPFQSPFVPRYRSPLPGAGPSARRSPPVSPHSAHDRARHTHEPLPANDHLSHRKNTQLPPPPAAPLEHSLRARARSSHRERLERKSTLAMPIGLFGAHTVHVRRLRAAASPPLPNHCRFPSATEAPVAPTTAYREAESRPVTSTLSCSRMPHSAP